MEGLMRLLVVIQKAGVASIVQRSTAILEQSSVPNANAHIRMRKV
jgi:hypothetical protein